MLPLAIANGAGVLGRMAAGRFPGIVFIPLSFVVVVFRLFGRKKPAP